MEAELLTKILASGGGVTAAIWFIYSMIKRVEKMHQEGMTKLDRAIDTVNNLALTLAVHAKELEHGDTRFSKIEETMELVRDRIHKLTDEVTVIKMKQGLIDRNKS